MAADTKIRNQPDKERRGWLAYLLGDVRDARSVETLIRLVDDREVLYLDYTGDVQVGDHALHSLAKLTGFTFGRDKGKWSDWWKKQDGHLPEINGPNKALEILKKETEQKGVERQKQFNH